jgi:hypothetical protein
MKPRLIVPALMSVALSACSVVGIRSGTPEPQFQVIGHVGAVEIRHYAPRIAAETTVEGSVSHARNQGFRRIAGYIFGGNRSRTKIAMTAPVAQSAGSGSEKIAMTAPVGQSRSGPGAWTIRFYMPAGSTMETLPVPNNPQVHLVTVPAEDYAALRFSGAPDQSTVAAKQAQLLAALRSSVWTPVGEPSAWFYDPPWTIPFLRRNEAVVQVTRAGGAPG